MIAEKYDPELASRLLEVLRLLGPEAAFSARKEAIIERKTTAIEVAGQLLGGKLTIKLEFDGADLNKREVAIACYLPAT